MKFIVSLLAFVKPAYGNSQPAGSAMFVQHSGEYMTKSFGLSICIHATLICLTVYLASQIEPAPQLMVIDFNLIETSAGVKKKTGSPSSKQIKQDIFNKPTQNRQIVAKEKNPPIVKPVPKPPVISRTTRKKKKVKSVSKVEIPKIKSAQTRIAQNKIEQPHVTPALQASEPQKQQEPVAIPSTVPPSVPVAANNAPKNGDSGLQGSGKALSSTMPNYVKANFQYIRQDIQKLIKYPRIARKMGWQGKVVVEFIVCKDGQVTDIHIVESSGFASLDKNAIVTIKKAAPFPSPSFPAKLIVPVVYRLS